MLDCCPLPLFLVYLTVSEMGNMLQPVCPGSVHSEEEYEDDIYGT